MIFIMSSKKFAQTRNDRGDGFILLIHVNLGGIGLETHTYGRELIEKRKKYIIFVNSTYFTNDSL